MASANHFISLAIAVILLPSIAFATEYVVGDDKGWTTNFDYQAWAKNKVFYVGDTLVFNYISPNHDVYKVNGTAFNDCIAPLDAEKFTSGNDKIELKTAGNKWYLCGKSGHCSTGQKLSITVSNSSAPQPAPSSSAAPAAIFFSVYQVFIALAVVLVVVNIH
ncbi:hypothetical protein TIFTF001_035908 [Ficus carica]|uniref:Phytocyanin domain-containing protein n=1 Tax=Ficus carica TaxID=3494 RepID=A0AA88JAM1_FICCA|nr:hypothetical protein TIFTF001_035880 [Ficus carica]GMN66818.1 hypothetical protein TIFTF001_035886 [Ficus carica]GMN66839.1 hypothetical protein TIFTF001_035902 [Ficus carica]GMN66840.1 hypothetical protein TIFTF001_035908 [Ficus carica]